MGRIAVEMGAVDGVGEVTARAAVAAELVDEEAGAVAVATEGAGPMADPVTLNRVTAKPRQCSSVTN